MWGLYQSAKLWNTRPSQLVDIEEPYEAYCFDEAVATWGTYVSNELEKIEGKDQKAVERKRNAKLNQLLDIPVEKRFRQVGRKKPVTKT